jgi:hypothetical protein
MTLIAADGLTVLDSDAENFSSEASEHYWEDENQGHGAPNLIC